jgi:hypothetical protein
VGRAIQKELEFHPPDAVIDAAWLDAGVENLRDDLVFTG